MIAFGSEQGNVVGEASEAFGRHWLDRGEFARHARRAARALQLWAPPLWIGAALDALKRSSVLGALVFCALFALGAVRLFGNASFPLTMT